MKKARITLGVVCCIFILCSLTYQPIVANKFAPITSKKDESSFDEVIIKWRFPLFCSFLYPIFLVILIIWGLTGNHDLFILMTEIEAFGINMDCWWTSGRLSEESVSDFKKYIKTPVEYFVLKDDCGCNAESEGIWPFPFLCSILNMFRFVGIFIFLVTQDLHFLNSILDIAEELDCNWLPSSM